MAIYIALIFTIFILFKFLKKKTALAISFILLALVAGLRKNTVGIDTMQYYTTFTEIGESSWSFSEIRFEKGYCVVVKILHLLFKNPQSLIICSSLFINFSIYKFIKNYSKNYLISILVFIFNNIYFSYMNIMRQALAISIILLGIKYLLNKKYIKFIIVILLASLFHTVAIASIILIPIYMLKDKKILPYLILFAGLLGFVLYRPLFNILGNIFGYGGYADSEFAASNYFGALISFCKNGIVFVIIEYYIYSNKLYEKDNNHNFYKNVILTAVMLYALIMRMNIFNRLTPNFIIFGIIYIPNSLLSIQDFSKSYRHKWDYLVMLSLIILILFSSWMTINILRPEWNGAIPYEFFWQ